MDLDRLKSLLENVRQGQTSPEEALTRLRDFPTEVSSSFRLDQHRALRKGFPETVLGTGKSEPELVAILDRLRRKQSRVLATRIQPDVGRRLARRWPATRYHRRSGLLTIGKAAAPCGARVVVVCAGNSDLPVAEEAFETLRFMGRAAELICDVGVAGLHRLLEQLPRLRRAAVVVAVAGMEGALVSVVAGLVDRPVVGVPTSVGYGGQRRGEAALFTMLNSCAPGVTVVNIDNGFGAAYAAALMSATPVGQDDS